MIPVSDAWKGSLGLVVRLEVNRPLLTVRSFEKPGVVRLSELIGWYAPGPMPRPDSALVAGFMKPQSWPAAEPRFGCWEPLPPPIGMKPPPPPPLGPLTIWSTELAGAPAAAPAVRPATTPRSAPPRHLLPRAFPGPLGALPRHPAQALVERPAVTEDSTLSQPALTLYIAF